MADTSIQVTPGTGPDIDFRTEGTNGNYRQVVVIGDGASNAGIAPVDATNGLSVNLTNASVSTTISERASSCTVTQVAASATSVTLAASNANRKLFTLYNDSSSYAYVKFGATASTTDYTFKMFPETFYEMPLNGYTGIVDCIWTTANGNMYVTEG